MAATPEALFLLPSRALPLNEENVLYLELTGTLRAAQTTVYKSFWRMGRKL
ncbi:hypothetical protein HUN01_28645 [Nostoc edaphicum CCNP1411]|uniref:Uncharacterized protein n=1 Tax=Nostoc edaphicum CCNP1411 TaxID=1472755 RepID=A0A7D7LGG6_9NOSO|nr:hypothetical protein [Nostoc edaphicum]QMS91374.1 hypothetical protein HUN01_28645 [Nostoc edaphicum CCNP1411]